MVNAASSYIFCSLDTSSLEQLIARSVYAPASSSQPLLPFPLASSYAFAAGTMYSFALVRYVLSSRRSLSLVRSVAGKYVVRLFKSYKFYIGFFYLALVVRCGDIELNGLVAGNKAGVFNVYRNIELFNFCRAADA